jgi:alpha-tubulin suppressor-like RCC1 family protein
VLHKQGRTRQAHEIELEPGIAIECLENCDNFKWRSVTRCWSFYAGVREDGTLWGWSLLRPRCAKNNQDWLEGTPKQVGKDTDWIAVAGDYKALAALKTDGSLWTWNRSSIYYGYGEVLNLVTQSPVRLGTHADWVAVGSAMNGIVSLAADGSLWYWYHRDPSVFGNSDQPLLAASRKPFKIENILDAQD